MKGKPDILAAVGAIVAGGIVTVLHLPGGTIGMTLIFLGMIAAPGYLLARMLLPDPFDPWEIYPLSLTLGVTCFGIVGMIMFLASAPIIAAYPAMAAVGLAFAVGAIHESPLQWEKGWSKETGWLGWSFAIVLALIFLVAIRLGSFRGWYAEWDYYTYITMVRRLVTRGFAGNFPLSYIAEGNDPIHSYNIWALMWAAISRGAQIEPVILYVRSGFLTILAAILAFYSLTKVLFNRSSAMAAAICYALYHLIALGFIELGSSSFFNDDPAWLIFFPTAIRLGWEYLDRRGAACCAPALSTSSVRGAASGAPAKQLIACVLAVAGTLMVHPLWGGLAALVIALAALTRMLSKKPGTRNKLMSPVFSRYAPAELAAWLGCALILAPSVWAMWEIGAGVRVLGTNIISSWWDFIILLVLPAALMIPKLVERISKNPDKARQGARLLACIAIVFAPLVLLRFHETRGARADLFEQLHPYKWYITDRLFVLNPSLYTYTEPGMTLYPWSLIGVAALPWLWLRARRGDRASYFVAAAILVIPLVAINPYLSWLFCKVLHPAYLKRALRVSGIFAAMGAGIVMWNIAGRAGKKAWVALIALAFAAAVGSSIYPVDPPYFQGALEKAWFIIKNPPSEGLFWAPDINADIMPDTKWDTEEFSSLLDHVPEGETVVSDAFTGYRLTAYRDVFVIIRPKPSFAVNDQASRDKDYEKLMTAGENTGPVCEVLRRYKSRWILFNADPTYRIRGHLMWDPRLIRSIITSSDYFELVEVRSPWGLALAKPECSPWPPQK